MGSSFATHFSATSIGTSVGGGGGGGGGEGANNSNMATNLTSSVHGSVTSMLSLSADSMASVASEFSFASDHSAATNSAASTEMEGASAASAADSGSVDSTAANIGDNNNDFITKAVESDDRFEKKSSSAEKRVCEKEVTFQTENQNEIVRNEIQAKIQTGEKPMESNEPEPDRANDALVIISSDNRTHVESTTSNNALGTSFTTIASVTTPTVEPNMEKTKSERRHQRKLQREQRMKAGNGPSSNSVEVPRFFSYGRSESFRFFEDDTLVELESLVESTKHGDGIGDEEGKINATFANDAAVAAVAAKSGIDMSSNEEVRHFHPVKKINKSTSNDGANIGGSHSYTQPKTPLLLMDRTPQKKSQMLDESTSSRFYGGLDICELSAKSGNSNNNSSGQNNPNVGTGSIVAPLTATMPPQKSSPDPILRISVPQSVENDSDTQSFPPASSGASSVVEKHNQRSRSGSVDIYIDDDDINHQHHEPISVPSHVLQLKNQQKQIHHVHGNHSYENSEISLALSSLGGSFREAKGNNGGNDGKEFGREVVNSSGVIDCAEGDKSGAHGGKDARLYHSSLPILSSSDVLGQNQKQQIQRELHGSANINYNHRRTRNALANSVMLPPENSLAANSYDTNLSAIKLTSSRRLDPSDVAIQNIIKNNAPSIKRQSGQRKRLGVKRMGDGVLADSMTNQKLRHAASIAARMNGNGGSYDGLGSSMITGGVWVAANRPLSPPNSTHQLPSSDAALKRGSTDSSVQSALLSTVARGNSSGSSSRRGSDQSRRDSSASATDYRGISSTAQKDVIAESTMKCSTENDQRIDADVRANSIQCATESQPSQHSLASATDSWLPEQVNGVDNSEFTAAAARIGNTTHLDRLLRPTHSPNDDGKTAKHSFLQNLILNATYLNPTQRKFRRKSSAISMLDNQFFVPPPEDGTTLFESLMYWLHGHGTDFVVWVYQSSFLGVLIVCIVFYYVMVFAFAGMLVGMESMTDGRCGLDHEKMWSKKQEFELAFELSWTTFTTVGYGQISPSGSEYNCYPIRIVCALFAFMGLLFNSLSAAIFFSKLERILTRASVTFSSSVCLQFGKSVAKVGGSRYVYGHVLKSGSNASLGGFSDKSIDSNLSKGAESSEDTDAPRAPKRMSERCPYPYIEFRIVNDHANYKNRAIWNAQVSAMVQLSAKDVEKREHRYNTSSGEIFREYVTTSTHSRDTYKGSNGDLSNASSHKKNLKQSAMSNLTASISDTAMVVQESDTGTGKGAHPEGRIYYPLTLEPSDHPYFRRAWYIRHTLNAKSPLLKLTVREKIRENKGWDPDLCRYEDILASLVEFHRLRITFKGTSAVSNKVVYAQKLYTMEDVFVGWQFGQIFYEKQNWTWFRRWWCDGSESKDMETEARDYDDSNLMLDKRLIHDIVPQPGGNHEPIEE